MSNASPRHKYISRCIQVVLITSNCFSWLSIFFRRVSHICFKAAQSSLALECHTYPDNFSQTKLRPMKWKKAFFAIANTWRKSFKKARWFKIKSQSFLITVSAEAFLEKWGRHIDKTFSLQKLYNGYTFFTTSQRNVNLNEENLQQYWPLALSSPQCIT